MNRLILEKNTKSNYSRDSFTWAVHVRILCQTYKLPDPLALMEGDLWPKNRWKSHIQTAIRVHHEALLRRKALSNSKVPFLNIQLTGLAGRHHPILSGVHTAQDVVKLRPHVKMLAGDYLSFSPLARERGSNPECRLCPSSPHRPSPAEDMIHILTRCRGTADTSQRMVPELFNTVSKYFPLNN